MITEIGCAKSLLAHECAARALSRARIRNLQRETATRIGRNIATHRAKDHGAILMSFIEKDYSKNSGIFRQFITVRRPHPPYTNEGHIVFSRFRSKLVVGASQGYRLW